MEGQGGSEGGHYVEGKDMATLFAIDCLCTVAAPDHCQA